jgi:cytosine/adenosine deaminase-related metal-dependent hydrolase
MHLNDIELGRRPTGRTALTARWIVGNEGGRHRLLRDGEIVIDGGEILYVGRRFEGEVARRIAFGEALISPGFVDLDALSDLDTTLLGVDNQPAWAKGRVWPRSYVNRGPYEMYSPDELAFQKKFTFAQLLMNGITTALPIASLFYREWGETRSEFDAAAQAAIDIGLRVFLGPAYRSGGMVCEGPADLRPEFNEQRGLQGLAEAITYIADWHGAGEGLVHGLLAPDRVETCTEALMRKTMAAADELDVPVRLHCAQGLMEHDTMQVLHGATAPQWLARIGALNARLIAPHATVASQDDLALYRDHGVTIAHCPLVAARSGTALRSFAKCRDMGINIGMGTDTAPPDMILNMAVGTMMARLVDDSPEAVNSSDMFNAATLGGAQALGRRDLGRLAIGARADIAVFDLADPMIAPTVDPIQSLVLGATGRITRTVFVDGRLSMHEGQVAGINMLEARAQAQKQFSGLVARYPERTFSHPPVEEIFPTSFPWLLP